MSVTAVNPGVRPLHPIEIALPDGRHNPQPVASKRYDSPKYQLPDLQGTAQTKRGLDPDLSKRQEIIDRWLSRFRAAAGVNARREKRSLRDIWFKQFRDATGINVSKRDVVNFDPFGSQILVGGKAPWEKRSLRDIWFKQFRDATGINVSKRENANGQIQARDTVADAQLQNFVSNAANLLRAVGKSDGKCPCISVGPNKL